MRRTFIIILSALILLSAAAADSQRSARKKSGRTTKTTKTTNTKKKKSARPAAIPVNIDSINAAARAQAVADSLTRLRAGVESGDVADIILLAGWYASGHNVDQDHQQAVDLYRKASDLGSVRAMASLGQCYELGLGVQRDSVEAARLYMQSIKEGNGTLFKQKLDSAATNAFDATIIATCYERGEGVKRDLNRAADLYASAANLGSVYATPYAALCYLTVGDTITAMNYLPQGARLGNVACQYWTGKLTLDGADPKTAVDYILTAANAGMPEAENTAGLLYLSGRHIKADGAQALDYFRKAARQGNADGMHNLGKMLYAGSTPDYCQAVYWLSKAAENGCEASYEAVEADSPFALYLSGLKAFMIDGDYAAADRNFKLSDKATKGECGKIMQAVMLADQKNPKANAAKAVKTLEKLLPGHPEAAFWLARIYDEGMGVPNDPAKAKSLYAKAQALGYMPDLTAMAAYLIHI